MSFSLRSVIEFRPGRTVLSLLEGLVYILSSPHPI